MDDLNKPNREALSSKSEFEKLLAQDLQERKFIEGEIVEGTISKVDDKFCFVDLNLRSEGAIPIEEFKLTKELDKIKVGQKIDVLLEKLENFNGEPVISREKARKVRSWKKMETAFENQEQVTGMILSRCRGGYVVDVESCLCFLPGSQVDLKPLKNIDHLMKIPQTFECVKLDKKRGNIVVSRRSILEKKRNESKNEILSKINVGDVVEGVCKNLTDWGAFLDLNGIDALLHITDISWSRVNRPSELISVGQTLKVKITKIDPETKKVSVGIKQLTPDPYIETIKNFELNKIYKGEVTKIQQYGVFCKLGEGLEGLIHQSELSWTKKNIAPNQILSISQQIEVQIIEIDTDKRRISLSYKNTQVNPWKKLLDSSPVGSTVSGRVKNITDFAVFINISETEIDGMIHYKDLSWSEDVEELKKYNKNDVVKVKILEIDQEKEKLRLSVKHLLNDPFDFYKEKKKGDVITVIVKQIIENGIKVSPNDNEAMSVIIKKPQLAEAPENQRPSRFNKGDRVDVLINELEHSKRKVSFSIKALEQQETKEAIKKYKSQDSGAKLADILGGVLKKSKK